VVRLDLVEGMTSGIPHIYIILYVVSHYLPEDFFWSHVPLVSYFSIENSSKYMLDRLVPELISFILKNLPIQDLYNGKKK
jgi:hypothetical protein